MSLIKGVPWGEASWESEMRYFAMDLAGERECGFAAVAVERR